MTRRSRTPGGGRGQRGQSLVEFALILPIVLLLLLAVIDIGMLLSTKNSVAYASRQAARLLESYGPASPDPQHPVGPDPLVIDAITDTLRGSGLTMNNLQKIVIYQAEQPGGDTTPAWTGDNAGADCVYTFSGGTLVSGSPSPCAYSFDKRQYGDYIGVAVTYTYRGLTPFYAGGVTFTDVTNAHIDPQSAGGYTLPTPVVPPTLVPLPQSIDDDDPALTYTGSSWHSCAGSSPCSSGQTLHYGNGVGDTVTIPFTGTGVAVYGATSPYGGLGDIAVDGATAATVTFSSTGTVASTLMWSTSGLTQGPHTLTVTVDTSPNTDVGNGYVDLDRVVASP